MASSLLHSCTGWGGEGWGIDMNRLQIHCIVQKQYLLVINDLYKVQMAFWFHVNAKSKRCPCRYKDRGSRSYFFYWSEPRVTPASTRQKPSIRELLQEHAFSSWEPGKTLSFVQCAISSHLIALNPQIILLMKAEPTIRFFGSFCPFEGRWDRGSSYPPRSPRWHTVTMLERKHGSPIPPRDGWHQRLSQKPQMGTKSCWSSVLQTARSISIIFQAEYPFNADF